MDDSTVNTSDGTVAEGPACLLKCPNEVLGFIAESLIADVELRWNPDGRSGRKELSDLYNFVRVNSRLFQNFSYLLYKFNASRVKAGVDERMSDVPGTCYSLPRTKPGMLTAMPFAAFYGHTETARRVIEVTPEVCAVHSVKTALRYGNIEIAEMLLSTASVEAEMTRIHNSILQAEANATERRQRGGQPWDQHPLSDAIRIGSLGVVQQLLPPGMDPNFELVKQLSLPSARSLSQASVREDISKYIGATPLQLACEHGRLDVVRFLLESGADPVMKAIHAEDESVTPLGRALQGGHGAVARELVNRCPQILRCTFNFCEALELGDDELVEQFLQGGADAYTETFDDEFIPLHSAISGDKVHAVRRLLDLGAELTVPEGRCHRKSQNVSAFMVAAGHAQNRNSLEIIEMLLSHTPEELEGPTRDPEVDYSLLRGALEADHRPMVKLLVEHVSHEAIMSTPGFCRSVPMIQLLLEHGADLNFLPSGIDLPLFMCTHWILNFGDAEPKDDAYEAAEFMAENVRNINQPCYVSGNTALYELCRIRVAILSVLREKSLTLTGGSRTQYWARYEKLVSILLKHGADPKIANPEGRTPLHEAAYGGATLQALQSLLEAGADPNAQDKEGWTPLHLLFFGNSADMMWLKGSCDSDSVEVLLGFGADMHILDHRGVPALSVDKTLPNSIVSHYLDLGLNPRLPCSHGAPLLVELAERGDRAIKLVERVLNMAPETVNAEDWDGFTPLSMAARGKDVKIARLLLKHGAAEKINAVNRTGTTALDEYLHSTSYLPDRDENFVQLMREQGAITTRFHTEISCEMMEMRTQFR